MQAISVVLIDYDTKFSEELEWKLLEELGERAEIESITEREYFETYFVKPKSIDVLVIHEKQYDQRVRKQNINLTFVLQEKEEESLEDSHICKLYKYRSLYELAGLIMEKISRRLNIQSNSEANRITKGIMIYSAIGGAGKTITALGLSVALAKQGKRVLYFNVENVQNFQWYLKDKSYAYEELAVGIMKEEEHALSYLKRALGQEEFDYVRPMRQSALAYGITEEKYSGFISRILEANVYDYIIFDVSSELTLFKTKLMAKCRRVVIVLQQDALSVYKTEEFLKNIDYSAEEKLLWICNNYQEERENHIFYSDILQNCTIAEYVGREKTEGDSITLEDIRRSNLFQAASYLLD